MNTTEIEGIARNITTEAHGAVPQLTISPLMGLRDLLLPRLVTGQIDVSSLDLDSLIEGPVG